MELQKGYSHEKFKGNERTIYKYTNDEKRFEFVRNQYEWLNSIREKFPQYGIGELELIRSGNELGYSMSRVNTVPLTSINAADLIKISKDIGLKPKELQVAFNGKYNVNIDMADGFDAPAKFRTFEYYIKYLKDIVLKNPDLFHMLDWYKYEKQLTAYTNYANQEISFCHGDLTIDNILWDGSEYTLIDPNFKNDAWSSYLLDLSKLFQETRFDEPELFNSLVTQIELQFGMTGWHLSLLFLLEISHYIRMIPYVIKHEEVYKTKIEKFKKLIQLL
jgi:hypothetical protein